MSREEFRSGLAMWLKRNRVALKLSQLEVADAIGASDRSVSKWERGEHDISAYHQTRLRAFFKRKVAELEAQPIATRPTAGSAVYA